ncbi:hypothetical protein KVV02_007186 [Mortierella alpina]|uniref:Uncharacterized protein n=1 Tax=Mortierella alpina TaxID=64518 RepID=A0A9P8A8K6_MORAP|nr:hypothetical protein KVV02_007186 [Mortierella alpina]
MSQQDLSKSLQLEEMLHRASEQDSRLTPLNGSTQDASKQDVASVTAMPRPSRVQRDPKYARQREEALRATGEILHQRCIAKLERLEKLKAQLADKQPSTKQGSSSIADRQLEILRLEEARLQFDCQKIQSNRDVYPEALPEVTTLKVRQMVQDSIRDYGIVTPRLQQELTDTQAELASEKKLLSELNEIKRALQARREGLALSIESSSTLESSQGRQKMLEARLQVQELMRELTGFLSRHYPAIQPDDDNPATFELKHVLEDIMNLSVSRPSDPYVVLVPGEYYPPHIEQLINAGIAVRHPRDAQRLRLVDFYS